ncbi:MAG: helix-turn-helix domain-containing protein [Bacteroidota bacterium]
MEERLTFIMKAKNLSMTQFADEIKVQRSNMSHVMNGRNKASLDFVSRILKRFPDINPDWLLFGKGSMNREEIPANEDARKEAKEYKTKAEALEQEVAELRSQLLTAQRKYKKEKTEAEDEEPVDYIPAQKIKSIVTLYSDDTFKIYSPK